MASSDVRFGVNNNNSLKSWSEALAPVKGLCQCHFWFRGSQSDWETEPLVCLLCAFLPYSYLPAASGQMVQVGLFCARLSEVHRETLSSVFSWGHLPATPEDIVAGSQSAWWRRLLWRSALWLLLVHRLHTTILQGFIPALCIQIFFRWADRPVHFG